MDDWTVRTPFRLCCGAAGPAEKLRVSPWDIYIGIRNASATFHQLVNLDDGRVDRKFQSVNTAVLDRK